MEKYLYFGSGDGADATTETYFTAASNLRGADITGAAETTLYFKPLKIGDAVATAGGFGGTTRIYSGSFTTVKWQQDYDLQTILSSASGTGVADAGNAVPFSGAIGDKRVIITKVFYRSPRAMWRFYGYYGGVNVIGN